MPDKKPDPIALLTIPLLAEPDKQRFAQFVMKALDMFGSSLFLGAARLPDFLSLLEVDKDSDAGEHLTMQLSLQANTLYLNEHPSSELILQVTDVLRAESEVSDPELLRLHNERIKKEMATAQQRASQEFAELEEKLNKKRSELQDSIRAAEIDSLTQIYNRGAYDRRLTEAVNYCQRQGGLLSLILLDLDYFKQVNDTLGHQAGDQVLKNMAEYMQCYTRKAVDHVCRMGGDEFAIIFFSEALIARRSAEKILSAMDGKVSIGIAELTADDSTQSLIARADTALYEAKERGRGQVVLDSELNGLSQSAINSG